MKPPWHRFMINTVMKNTASKFKWHLKCKILGPEGDADDMILLCHAGYISAFPALDHGIMFHFKGGIHYTRALATLCSGTASGSSSRNPSR